MLQGPIYHLAVAEDWDHDETSAYTTSTLGRSLAEQGFVHCSYASQVQQVADALYRCRADVLLLEIDPARLTAFVRVENLEGGDEEFPHIYGPINRDAVMKITPVTVLPDGQLDIASLLEVPT